ncbi:DUF5329 domain-containing protein [Gilvimarinus algae]|uniref:DUF5329 domain-containing protein n=1 Tax=Gilvimarinus algae TaxID=3058037 RepID=A0ABT8TH27_9GAMM|nr:DUF5329 domain-containing protein [Gilvimarinus sp. SDUM040014]MDO3383358.1 DUF5329 domain-containing protein [Gilvimarinus sp. SDUM040014]
MWQKTAKWFWVVWLLVVAERSLAESEAQREITGLIQHVAQSGVVFIRNGSEHTAEEAADHLAMKYRRASRYASTAEEFIDNLASKSSITGRPYQVRLADGTQMRAGQWLHTALQSLRLQRAAMTDAKP